MRNKQAKLELKNNIKFFIRLRVKGIGPAPGAHLNVHPINKFFIIADNSGIPPALSSIPVIQAPMKFKIGSTVISIQATDLAGNVQKCQFIIRVLGEHYEKATLIHFSPYFYFYSALLWTSHPE